MQSAIRYGLILGLLAILALVFAYLMGVEFAASYSFAFLIMSIWLGGSLFGAWRIKKENKGSINYGQAFSWVILMISIAWFVNTTYGYVFNNFIDTEYSSLLVKTTIDKMDESFANSSLSEEQADKIIAETQKNLEETYGYQFIGILKGMLSAFIMAAAFSLLSAIFVQRKQQENAFLYDNEDETFEEKFGSDNKNR